MNWTHKAAVQVRSPVRSTTVPAASLSEAHLERVLEVFVTHYNEHRPHRALSLAPPEPRRSWVAAAAAVVRVHRRDRLGGVIREYILAA